MRDEWIGPLEKVFGDDERTIRKVIDALSPIRDKRVNDLIASLDHNDALLEAVGLSTEAYQEVIHPLDEVLVRSAVSRIKEMKSAVEASWAYIDACPHPDFTTKQDEAWQRYMKARRALEEAT